MSECSSIDPLITPYVDDDIDATEKRRVDDHVRRCPPCHSRVAAERAVRDLVRVNRAEIAADAASETLRARCAALRAGAVAAGRAPSPPAWRTRMKPLAVAAGVMLAAGGVFVYTATGRSTRVLAAELTADHVKCFGVVNTLVGTNANAAAVEQVMADVFGWQMHVPEPTGEGLELVGARPCLYARGAAAHLMYRHHGQPLSVFMLPQLSRPGKPDERVDVMGHEAAVWSKDGRTFVLIAREPEDDMRHVVSVVQAALH
jgi:anti-sigma factor RsiW